MRVIKVFVALLCAVFFGFVIHFNWAWLNHAEPIVVFSYVQTQPAASAEIAADSDASSDSDATASGDSDSGGAAETQVERRIQTVPLPMWAYLLIALLLGALFMLIGSLREILLTRRERRRLARERKDLVDRYGQLRGADDQDVAYNVGDSGRDELRP